MGTVPIWPYHDLTVAATTIFQTNQIFCLELRKANRCNTDLSMCNSFYVQRSCKYLHTENNAGSRNGNYFQYIDVYNYDIYNIEYSRTHMGHLSKYADKSLLGQIWTLP